MKNFFAICFDVCDPKRLRRVSDQMENFGSRVQRSLFECYLDHDELEELKTRIADLIDEKEDNVRYYPLCQKDVPCIVIEGHGEISVNSDYYTA